MLYTVKWSPASVREIWAIHDYIAGFNPKAAAGLADRLFNAGNSLVTNPHRGRPVADTGLRELTIVYPYIIRYRAVGGEVRIMRVRHGMRLQ